MIWEKETEQDRNGGREGGGRRRSREDVQCTERWRKREKTLVPPPLCDLLKL